MPRRNHENRLMGTPIIELEFEKDVLDQRIIIGGENIQLWMKKERPILYERCLQLGQYCRSHRELYTNCAEHLQERRMHSCGGNFCIYCKKPFKTGDKKICEEYKMEAIIQSKIRLNKCDVYTKKNTSLQGKKILSVSGKRTSKKRRKTEKNRRRNKPTVKL